MKLKTITKEMIKEKLTIDTIKRCTKLTEKEIKEIQLEMKKDK